VWHKKDREKGQVPHTSIDTQAHWTKSGWHGWVYGWKLHIACVVASVWIPLSAQLTPANEADNEIAPALIYELPPDARFLLGDLHYNAPNVHEVCKQTGRILVTTKYGPYPHTDPGVEVRRIFHKLRSPSKISTSISKAFSMDMDKSPQKDSPTRSALPWVPSLFTNSPCSTVFSMVST
jgi:hypothetical protein